MPGTSGQEAEHAVEPTDGDGACGAHGGRNVGRVRFSISLPQLDVDGFDAAGFKDYLAARRGARLRGGWTLEQTIGAEPLIAPLELLSYAAACTTRLRLGVAVLVSSLHDPLQLAATATAVDRLSHGRLDLGVAPGGGRRQFAAFGVDPKTFISSFTEGLELMKAAWSDEERVTFHGRFRDVDDLPIQPKPVQRPHPPIWFGGNAPAALARAVRLGDSFLGAGSSTTETFVEGGRHGATRTRRAGQGPGRLHHRQARLPDDRRRRRPARERVVAGLHRKYGGMPGIEAVPVSGTPADVVAGLRAVIDAGAEMILLNPLGDDVAEDREQMERLAAEVLPADSAVDRSTQKGPARIACGALYVVRRLQLGDGTACGADLLARAATELVGGDVDLDGQLAVAEHLDQGVLAHRARGDQLVDTDGAALGEQPVDVGDVDHLVLGAEAVA